MGLTRHISTGLAASMAAAAAAVTAIRASGGDLGLHPMPRLLPFSCSCDDEATATNEGLARCQLASDFLIALAYFSIPLELVYFFLRSKVLPHRWLLLQFGLFIVLCGMTHLVNIWTYGAHSFEVGLLMTVLKVSTAAVSCATAFLLIRIIPALLSIKVRELFLQHKAAQLDREMDVMKRQEEASRYVRMLTHEIRQSLDRHTILNTTLVQLANALGLANCTIWLPDASGDNLELTHELERRLVQVPVSVRLSDDIVQSVISSPQAVRLPPSSALALSSNPRGMAAGRSGSSSNSNSSSPMAAVRLPVLPVHHLQQSASSLSPPTDASPQFGIMVLLLQGDGRRQWKAHEVEMVEVVADQVAVALSHAAVLEESQRTRDALEEQNRLLQAAQQKAEAAVVARNDFLTVMGHEMRTPLHAIVALTSILEDHADLSREQRQMVETILRSSGLMTSLISDVLKFSRLEESSLLLSSDSFDLPSLFAEAAKLTWPLAHAKGLSLALQVADAVPTWVKGDEKRLLQAMLHLICRAISAASQGVVKVKVSLDHDESSNATAQQQPSSEVPSSLAAVRIRSLISYSKHKPNAAANQTQEITALNPSSFESHPSTISSNLSTMNSSSSTMTSSPPPVIAGRWSGPDSPSNDSNEKAVAAGLESGFAIFERLVELMGGRLVTNETESSGGEAVECETSVTVPLQLHGSKKHHRGSKSQALQDMMDELSGLKVLVVEDNTSNQLATLLILEELGCKATVAESAAECFALLTSNQQSVFDIILLDICMPDMDGFYTAQKILQMFRSNTRPLLVALTARTDKGVEEACTQSGMDGVIFKPATILQVASTLCDLLATES